MTDVWLVLVLGNHPLRSSIYGPYPSIEEAKEKIEELKNTTWATWSNDDFAIIAGVQA